MLDMIPDPSLKKWATKKFIDKQSTMELMASVTNPKDLAAIAVVALLEVSPGNRYQGLCKEEADYIKSCHDYLRTVQITGAG
jgi:hypothetical protein